MHLCCWKPSWDVTTSMPSLTAPQWEVSNMVKQALTGVGAVSEVVQPSVPKMTSCMCGFMGWGCNPSTQHPHTCWCMSWDVAAARAATSRTPACHAKASPDAITPLVLVLGGCHNSWFGATRPRTALPRGSTPPKSTTLNPNPVSIEAKT